MGLMLCFSFILAASEGYKGEPDNMDQSDRDPKRPGGGKRKKKKKNLAVNSTYIGGMGGIFRHVITIHIRSRPFYAEIRLKVLILNTNITRHP